MRAVYKVNSKTSWRGPPCAAGLATVVEAAGLIDVAGFAGAAGSVDVAGLADVAGFADAAGLAGIVGLEGTAVCAVPSSAWPITAATLASGFW